MHKITDDLYEIRHNGVNTHLITADDAMILIDTGTPGSEKVILEAMGQIGRRPSDLTHIIVTHSHADHAGSLAALQAATRAVTLMHPADAEIVRAGRGFRLLTPTPGWLNRLLFSLFIAPTPVAVPAARVDATVQDGELLPLAGGLRVIHTPGHSAGQIALLWEVRDVLFAADAVMNLPHLRYSLAYEDFVLGRETAVRLAGFEFNTACFGHGRPLVGGAQTAFNQRFCKQEVHNYA